MKHDVQARTPGGGLASSAGRSPGMVPHINLQAFCETDAVAGAIGAAAEDRRFSKVQAKVHMGGAAAAVEAYRDSPTPNVVAVEVQGDRQTILSQLDELAEFCDAGSKVIVIGRVNDIILYRELIARGVSQYLVAPFDALYFVESIAELYTAPGTTSVGRVFAIYGAKGGVGASTVAHNLAWTISRGMDAATTIADFDLAFGTVGLDFNQDPPQTIAEAVFAKAGFDSAMLERLLTRCSERLSLLAAPALLDRTYDVDDGGFEPLIDSLRSTVPFNVLDVPHVWSGWARHALVSADEIAIVATPDLASLRNTKSLVDTLRAARPNDAAPKLVMNMTGVPKRPEIAVDEFAKAVEITPTIVLPFEPKIFGTAANNGQMIGEVEPGSKIAESFAELARVLTGRAETRPLKRGIFEPLLEPLMGKIARRKAS